MLHSQKKKKKNCAKVDPPPFFLFTSPECPTKNIKVNVNSEM